MFLVQNTKSKIVIKVNCLTENGLRQINAINDRQLGGIMQ